MVKSEAVKWFAGVSATIIAGVTIWLITSSDSPFRDDPEPAPPTTTNDNNNSNNTNKSKLQWEKNWKQINEPVPFLGTSKGVKASNREKLLQIIQNLDFPKNNNLQEKKDRLIQLIKRSPPNNDPYYNMQYTDEIRSAFDELKRLIRNAAIDHGVPV